MLRILRLSCVRWSLAVMMGGMMSMAEAKEAEELAWAGIFPGQIKTVALVAPACPANSSEALDRAIARLKQAGICVKLMPHAREGEPATRYETIADAELLRDELLKAVYGEANVSGTLAAGLTVKANSAAQESAVWVIDMILRDNYARRIVIPAGTITELGEITYADESSIGYPVTITAVADSSGNTHYGYTAKPAED